MDLTSSLTSLETISTPESYYTAKGSPVDGADTTAISTPVQDPRKPRYRGARQIPHELKAHCQIHLEEELYSQAIQLFDGFLSDGNKLQPYHNQATPATPAARIPPPSQIALLNTLTIHPAYTSRAHDRNNLHVAAQSLNYLHGLLNIVGPVNANLRQAFAFAGSDGSSGRRGRGYNSSTGDTDDSDSDCVETRYAKEQSIWQRAPDFWAVLGWAFRCAASYPHRWVYWKSWLEYIVKVLEEDWDERMALDKDEHEQRELQGGSSPGEECAYPRLRESLLTGYLDDLHRERKQPLREVLRALMAFTDADSSADVVFFKEVFSGETVVGPRKNKRKRAQTVDLEKDQFGDYLDMMNECGSSDEEQEGGPPTPTKAPAPAPTRRGRRIASGTSSTSSSRRQQQPQHPPPQPKEDPPTDGIAESVPLRLRIFRILSAAAFYLPPTQFARVDVFYEQTADRIRALPLPLFKLFVSSHSTPLPEFAHVSLLRHIIEGLLPAGGRQRPDPEDVDKETDKENGISLAILQECFLPFAAGRVTVEDNAKLGVVLEGMLWFLFVNREVEYTEGLREAVEGGIRKREEKSRGGQGRGGRGGGGGGGGGDGGDSKVGREALERSARSLRGLVGVLKAMS